jgi:hypothetical protein
VSVQQPANPVRGEAAWRIGDRAYRLRPTFAALVAAETEIGPLFAFVERAADGRATLGEIAALFWHCMADREPALTRAEVGDALVTGGLAAATPVLRAVLMQVMQGA